MLETALKMAGPTAIRFSKTRPVPLDGEVGEGLNARKLRTGDGSLCLLGVGKLVANCVAAAEELAADGIEATVWDVRVVSPPDEAMLEDAASCASVVTAEDGSRLGGAGMFLADAMTQRAVAAGIPAPPVTVLGTPRRFLAQGEVDEILASVGLDGSGIAASARRSLSRRVVGR